MSRFVTALHEVKYQNNIRHALQHKDSKLRAACRPYKATAALEKLEDIVGETGYYFKRARHEDTKFVETPFDNRWVAMPPQIVYSELVDKEDKLASGIELEGTYVDAGRKAIARGTDAMIIDGMLGVAQTGERGTVLTPFNGANVVPANTGSSGGATGLNYEKIASIIEILATGNVDLDEEEIFMIVPAKGNRQLLSDLRATSKDFGASGEEVRRGRINDLQNITFIPMELNNPKLITPMGKTVAELTLGGNGYRRLPFWTKSGVVAATWEEDFIRVAERPDKHFSAEPYVRRQIAATRTDEALVGYVEIVEN